MTKKFYLVGMAIILTVSLFLIGCDTGSDDPDPAPKPGLTESVTVDTGPVTATELAAKFAETREVVLEDGVDVSGLVPAERKLTVKGATTVTETLTVEGTLTVAGTQTIVRTGTISVVKDGTLKVTSMASADLVAWLGYVTSGTLEVATLSDTAKPTYIVTLVKDVLTADKKLAVTAGAAETVESGSFSIPAGLSLTIPGALTVEEDGTLTVDGTLDVAGALAVKAARVAQTTERLMSARAAPLPPLRRASRVPETW
jgi:hypothetical protein